MKRNHRPGLGRRGPCGIGGHLVKIARFGRIDHVTGQVRAAAEVHGENELVRVVFDDRLRIEARCESASQFREGVGAIRCSNREARDNTGLATARLPVHHVHEIPG